MLWHIEGTFFLLYYRSRSSVVNLHQCLYELCPFLELNKLEIHSLSALFSYILWHIELIFCTCICVSFNELQIKFECNQFLYTFVGVMPLLELRIQETYSIPYFSPMSFDLLSWNLVYMTFFLWTWDPVIVSTWDQVWRSYAPLDVQFCTLFLCILWDWTEVLNISLIPYPSLYY